MAAAQQILRSAPATSAGWNARQLRPDYPSAHLPDRPQLAPLRAVGRESEPMRADKAVDVVDADSSFPTSRSSS